MDGDPLVDHNAGYVSIFFGNTSSSFTANMSVKDADASFLSAVPREKASWESMIMNINNDAYDDLIISSTGNATVVGNVYVVLGGPTSGFGINSSLSDADIILYGENPDQGFGGHISPIGDFDHNGFPDFVTISAGNDVGTTDGGRIYVVLYAYGTATEITETTSSTTSTTSTTSTSSTSTTTSTTPSDTDEGDDGFVYLGIYPIIGSIIAIAIIRKRK